jgi:ribose-phosphate pyrophosphokinase
MLYQEPWNHPLYDAGSLGLALHDVRLVTGSSHPELAQEVARQVGVPLTDMGVSYFSNTETRVKPTSDPASTFRGKRVFIIQTGGVVANYAYEQSLERAKMLLLPKSESDENIDNALKLLQELSLRTLQTNINDHVMELGLMMDALRRGACKEIVLLVPCYPYARQDKKDTSRAPISARFVADLLKLRGVDRIVCFDLHNPSIQGFFDKCCDNIFATKVLREWLMNHVFKCATIGDRSYAERFVLIAPDAGALHKVEKVAGYLGLEVLPMNKSRDYAHKNKVKSIQLSVPPDLLLAAGRSPQNFLAGKTPIIVDDMADTCNTVVAAVNKLMTYGANKCIVAVTHGVLSGPALDNITNCDGIELVLVSDTLPQHENKAKCNKIQVYSIAGMLAEIIRRTVMNQSYASLMDL